MEEMRPKRVPYETPSPKRVAYDSPHPGREIRYQDYINLIRSEAYKRVNYNPLVDLDELMGRGHVAFVFALRTWDPAIAEFSTHLWWQIQAAMKDVQGLRNFIESTVPWSDALDEVIGDPQATCPYEFTRFRAGLSSLSQEALEVVWIVLNAPEEFTDWAKSAIRPHRRNLRRCLQRLGWKHPKINKAFKEIIIMLKNL